MGLAGNPGGPQSSQTKKYLVQMLKRSKSKEASAAGTGSQTQRISTNSAAGMNDNTAAEAANG